jgi:CRP-like cAMP-binding protein
MDQKQKLDLLASVSLWEGVPKDRLASLADYLRPESHKKGEVVFEEGSKGDGLYFVSTGHVQIRKKMRMPDGGEAHKELAVLGPGNCMGEMTLFDEVPRSAQAVASDDCVLLKLGRDELSKWLKANPALAADFLIGLVQVLSKRLRRSSSELTTLFDISQWLLEPIANGRELLQKSLGHLLPHLEGGWSAGAFLYNEFNDEMEMVAAENGFEKIAPSIKIQADASEPRWLDERTFFIPLRGKKRLAGHLDFHTEAKLSPAERDETARLLTTSSRLIGSTLENIGHRSEDALRSRLSATRQQYGSGF